MLVRCFIIFQNAFILLSAVILLLIYLHCLCSYTYFLFLRSRIWIHDINREREVEGQFHTLYPKLRRDEKRFYDTYRMYTESFDEILNMIKFDITKSYTEFRRPIGPEERLAITLR